MLIEASEILKLPVGDLREQTKLGEVSQVLIEPNNLALLALVVDVGNFLFKKIYLVSFQDIIEIDQKGVVIKNRGDLLHPKELVRPFELLSKKFNLQGLPVKTEKSKKYLGRVSNYLIETTLGSVQKLYLKKGFQERIIPANQIVKVSLKEIVIKEEKIMGKEMVERAVPKVEPA